MIVLDTNVVSALRRPEREPASLRRWAADGQVDDAYLSVITIMELEIGVLRLERRDPPRGVVLRRWFQQRVLETFEGRILPLDLRAARQCALLHVPDHRPDRDAMIAATAMSLGVPVATRNVADFAATGVELINPWDYAPPRPRR